MDLKSKYIGLLLVLYFQNAEACLKKPDDGSGSNTGLPTSTKSPTSSNNACTKEESDRQKCLNGGECVVTELWGSRQTQCNCLKDYEGSTCESRTGPLSGPSLADLTNSSIAGIVVGIIVLLALIGGIIFLVIRKRRKDSMPKLDEPEEISEKNSGPSNYAASRHFYNSNQQTFSNFGPGFTNVGYASDVSSNPKPPPHSTSGNSSTPSKRSGAIVVDSDEKDAHSSRPPSSSGGSVFHTSGSLGPIKVPLAFHETGV